VAIPFFFFGRRSVNGVNLREIGHKEHKETKEALKKKSIVLLEDLFPSGCL